MKRLRLFVVAMLLAAGLLQPAAALPRRSGRPSVVSGQGQAPRRVDVKIAPVRSARAPAAAVAPRGDEAMAAAIIPGAAAARESKDGSLAADAGQSQTRPWAGVFDGTGAREALRDWFGGLVQSVIPDPAVTERRAKTFLPGIRAAHAGSWRSRLEMRPEEANGVGTEEALNILSGLKKASDPAEGGRLIRNGTYFKSLPGGRTAVVKKVFRRSMMGDSRVYHVVNNVRYEVLAYHLDRHLGTHLVPPAVLLDRTTAAQLKVDAWPIGVGDASRAPPNLMEMSHLALLDALMSNPDRDFPGNLLQDERGKLVAIDFDLSRPHGFSIAESVERALHVRGVLLEPGRTFWGRGDLPGVFSKKVISRLKGLDAGALDSISRRGNLELNKDEVAGLLSAREAILHAIESLRTRYGGLIDQP